MRDMTEIAIRGITKRIISKDGEDKKIDTDDVTICFETGELNAQNLRKLFEFEVWLNNLIGTNCRFHVTARALVLESDKEN